MERVVTDAPKATTDRTQGQHSPSYSADRLLASLGGTVAGGSFLGAAIASGLGGPVTIGAIAGAALGVAITLMVASRERRVA
jgi:hypothetical protein